MQISIVRLSLVLSSALVPSGLLILYLLETLGRLISPMLGGPYASLELYLLLLSSGASLFLFAVYLVEETVGRLIGLERGFKIVRVRSPHDRPRGFTVGGLYRSISVVIADDAEVERFIALHEEAHARFRHPAKVWTIGSMLFGEVSALSSMYILTGPQTPQYIYIFSSSLIISTLYLLIVIIRILEIQADVYVYRSVGPRSYDLYIKFVKERYGRRYQPLTSRITHTSGDIALLAGDPMAPHAPWEFPLLFSLLGATEMVPVIANYSKEYQSIILFNFLLVIIIYIVISLLSIINEKIILFATRSRITSRSASNLAKFFTGLSISSALPLAYGAFEGIISVLIGSLIYYKFISIFLNNRKNIKLFIIYLEVIIVVLMFQLFRQ